jgi:hypothetical protein
MVIFHSYVNVYQRVYDETFGLSCPIRASPKKTTAVGNRRAASYENRLGQRSGDQLTLVGC